MKRTDRDPAFLATLQAIRDLLVILHLLLPTI